MNRRDLVAGRLAVIEFSLSISAIAKGDDHNGYLFRKLTGSALEKYGTSIRGWAQMSATFNDHNSDDQTITGSFNHDEGFTLNQIALQMEKTPKSNVIGRVGPFPGTNPESVEKIRSLNKMRFPFSTLVSMTQIPIINN